VRGFTGDGCGDDFYNRKLRQTNASSTQKGGENSVAVYPGTKKPENKEKRNLVLPAAIVAGVLLLLFMGWLYQKNFGPAPVPPPTGVAKTNNDYINGLYDRTGGSWDKLTDEEKQKVNQMANGYGQIAFQNIKK